MSAFLLPQGKQQYFSNAGLPLAGGKLYTYDVGTANPRTTWADTGQIAPNTNPIILDARGETTVFWSGSYRVTLKDSLDNTIWTVEAVAANADPSDVLRADLANSGLGAKGAGLVGFDATTNYPTPTTVGGFLGKLYKRTVAEAAAGILPTNYFIPSHDAVGVINVRRYGAALDAVWNGTLATGTDDSASFSSAIAVASAAGGGDVIFDGPTIVKNVALKANVNVRGVGNPTVYLNPTSFVTNNGQGDVAFVGLGVIGGATAVIGALAQGATVVPVANTAAFSVGQRVMVQTTGTNVPSDYIFYGGAPLYPTSNGRKQEFNRVISIVPNTSITLETDLLEGFATAQICPVSTPCSNFVLSGFTIQNQVQAANWFGGGVLLWFCTDFEVHIKVIGAGTYGLRLITCAYADCSYNTFRDCQNVGSGLSSGLSSDVIESSHNVNFHHNFIAYATEDEVGMRVRYAQFTNNHYRNCFDSGINTHGNGNQHILIADNDIDGCQVGIAVGYSSDRTFDSYITVARNKIGNSGSHAISVASNTGLGAITGGAAYINGTYANVPLTGGSGIGWLATITVAGGAVTAVSTTSRGVGYLSGDVLSAAAANLGGAGAGFSVPVSVALPAQAPHQFVRVIDNDITGVKLTAAGTTDGILCSYVNDLEVRGNTLDGTTIGNAPDAGISLQNCSRLVANGNRVRNFTLGYGIQIVNCTDYDVGPNYEYNNQNQFNTINSAGKAWIHGHSANTTTNSIEASNVIKSWDNPWDGPQATQVNTITYSAAMTPDAAFVVQSITATSGAAFTINAPLNPPTGLAGSVQRLIFRIRNSSGGALGAITWNAIFKRSATSVSAATGNSRSIAFWWDGTNWIEEMVTAADVPN